LWHLEHAERSFELAFKSRALARHRRQGRMSGHPGPQTLKYEPVGAINETHAGNHGIVHERERKPFIKRCPRNFDGKFFCFLVACHFDLR
jgi:hypothetical protein